LVSGGDVGPTAEHPSQALIDLFAMEELLGPVGQIDLAIVGDPRMRAVRSLLALLSRRAPASLTLVVDPSHAEEVGLPRALVGRSRLGSWEQLGKCNAVYVAGIPDGAIPLSRREALRVTAERASALSAGCVLLSPMPLIDEMDESARQDHRNKMFEQSDLGLFVRMAILELAVGN